MTLPRIIFANFCLILVAFVFACSPAWADGLTASPNSVAFQIVTGGSSILTQEVAISGASGALTVSCPDTVTVLGTAVPVFVGSVTGTSTVQISLNSQLSSGYYLPDTKTGTCTVRDAANASVAINVTVTKGGSITFNVTPTSWTPQAPTGSTYPQSTTLTISGGSLALPFTATSNQSWLTANPASGTTVPNSTTTVQLQVNPSGLTAGTYSGTVTVKPTSGTAVAVTVTFTIGGAIGNLYVSPTSLTYNYTTGGGEPPDQTVYIQSGIGATTFTAYSDSTWLTLGTSSGYIPYSLPVHVNVSAAPTGTSYGRIYIYDNVSSTQTVLVTLNSNTTGTGTVSANPSSVYLTYPGTTQTSIQVVGAASVTAASAYSASNWLSVTPSGTTVYVTANGAGLLPSTYTGNIYITTASPAASLVVPVTFQVGTGGGVISGPAAGPSTLTFTMQQGGSAPQYQTIAVAGASGGTYTATVTTDDGGGWLALSAPSGATPATPAVSLSSLVTTMAVGNYYGTISVTSGLGSTAIRVTLQIVSTATPVVMPGPGDIAVNYQTGGTAPGVQYVQLATSPATAALTFGAVSNTSWITVTPASGTTPGSFAVVVNPAGLPLGINAGTITITTSGAANSVITYPVIVNVYGTQNLMASPSSLSFTTALGNSPATQTLSLSTSVAASYTATVNSSGWLSVSPTSGTTPATLTVSVNSTTLAAGTYTGTITIYANNLTQVVNVTLTVGGGVAGTLSASPLSVLFDYVQGDSAPAAKNVSVSSSGSSLTYTATTAVNSGSGWLSVTPGSGSTPATLSVSVSPASLAVGTYTGRVTIASAGATGSPQTVNVTLTVRAAPTLAVDQGALSFAFRTDGAAPASQTVRVTSSGSDMGFSAAANANWLSVSPATGTTPANVTIGVQPAGLGVGRYTGAVTISATGGRSSTQRVDVTLVITAPLPTITRVANVFSYGEDKLAPGEAFIIAGTNLGPADLVGLQTDDSGRLTTALSDVRVRVNGVEAPLLYVSAGQVAAIAPYRIAGSRQANVQLEYQGARSNTMTLEGAASAPGIATANASGTGQAAALNQDYSYNSASNAAARGSVVMLYVTGEGQTLPFGEDGKIARGEAASLPKPILPVTATVDGRPANVGYAGAAPGMVAGVMQVNVEVPAASGTGNVPVVIRVGDADSQSGVTIAVK